MLFSLNKNLTKSISVWDIYLRVFIHGVFTNKSKHVEMMIINCTTRDNQRDDYFDCSKPSKSGLSAELRLFLYRTVCL